jgi:microcystin-dependent protein
MTDQFLGEIRLFAGNFAPNGWAFCEGQILAISQATALFSLLGTNYGGDGRSTFALPNLSGMVPIHAGASAGPGLNERTVGEQGGVAQVVVSGAQLPAHSHPAFSLQGKAISPVAAIPAAHGRYRSTLPAVNAAVAGHNNRSPYLGISYIIALVGIFPSRP